MPLLATSASLVQWGCPQDPLTRCHGAKATAASRNSLVAQDAFRRGRLRELHAPPPSRLPQHALTPLGGASRPWRFQSVALSVLFATKPRLSGFGISGFGGFSGFSGFGGFGSASLTASSGCPCRTPSDSFKPSEPVSEKSCVFSLTGLPCLAPSVKTPSLHSLPDAFLGCCRPCGIWNEPSLLRKRIPDGRLTTDHPISTGAFGEVLLGQCDGRRVAVKRLAGDHQTKHDAVTFAREIRLMVKLHHHNIAAFVGVEWSKQWLVQAVSEFVEGGDLRSLLDFQPSSLSWAADKCQIAIDVADALSYLHELSPLVTMEVLKARNVLLTEDMSTAKLSLFAVARTRSVFGTSGADASYRWLAPEVSRGEPLTELSVVYSFGVLLWELDSGKLPYHDAVNPNGKPMSSFKIMLLVGRGDLSPQLTSECPESITRLANECLSLDPTQRPSAASIAYRLRAILKNEL